MPQGICVSEYADQRKEIVWRRGREESAQVKPRRRPDPGNQCQDDAGQDDQSEQNEKDEGE
jgi:hypothetical protein